MKKKLNIFYALVIVAAYFFVSTEDFNEAVSQAQFQEKQNQLIAEGGF
jgi:hypothetical protein